MARAEAYLHAKFHLDPSNRLATIDTCHTRQDRQTGQRSDSIGRTVLANVNSRSLHAVAVRLSVCNARAPYSGGCNFRQYFYGIWHLGHPLTSGKILRRSFQGNPSVGELNTTAVAKYSDFGLSQAISRKWCKIGGKLVAY